MGDQIPGALVFQLSLPPFLSLQHPPANPTLPCSGGVSGSAQNPLNVSGFAFCLGLGCILSR